MTVLQVSFAEFVAMVAEIHGSTVVPYMHSPSGVTLSFIGGGLDLGFTITEAVEEAAFLAALPGRFVPVAVTNVIHT